MSGQYLKAAYNLKETPQSQQIPDSNQVPNSAGGYSWAVDDWKRLDRFLILGSEGGSYYATEQKLSLENAEAVRRLITADGKRVVARTVEISEAGRAPKNDPALFVLAMCASFGDDSTRKYAVESLPRVARIGTHLFHFVAYIEGFRGWGRGLRRAIGNWYQEKSPDELAFQVVKYQQRDEWSHADLLRLSHPKPADAAHQSLYKWVVDGEIIEAVPELIIGFDRAQKCTDEKELVGLINRFKLTMEMVPTQFHSSAKVYEALLPNLGLTAVMRNLGNMTKCGFLARGKWDEVNAVCSRIVDTENLRKSRVHPISILAALHTYQSGHGLKGSGQWDVVPEVVDALDTAFYAAFHNVEPTGQRILLALDISGSMSSGAVSGNPALTPRVASAAMAMVAYKTEPKTILTAFCEEFVPINLSRYTRLSDVVQYTQGLRMGGTDCALPMLWALQQKVTCHAFVIYTDSETWYGKIHPVQALQQYRRQMGIPAKLIVVGMVSNGFSIADPNDSGMLDMVGFDSAAPEVMANFIRG